MVAWSRHEAGQYDLDLQASLLYELHGLSMEADVLGTSATPGLYEQVLQNIPIESAALFAQRLFLRLISLLTGEATLHGIHGEQAAQAVQAMHAYEDGARYHHASSAIVEARGMPAVLAAEVCAHRVAALLQGLLRLIPGLSSTLAERFHEELLHLVRTPESRDMLAARSCNVVLSRWTMEGFDSILQRLMEAPRANACRSDVAVGKEQMSVSQLSRGMLQAYKMPGLQT